MPLASAVAICASSSCCRVRFLSASTKYLAIDLLFHLAVVHLPLLHILLLLADAAIQLSESFLLFPFPPFSLCYGCSFVLLCQYSRFRPGHTNTDQVYKLV